MALKNRDRRSIVAAEGGQALIETMLVVPFFILLMMVLGEFCIYFYRVNLLENTAQQVGRMTARNATYDEINSYASDKLSSLGPTPVVTVKDAGGVEVTDWESDDSLEIKIMVEAVESVLPIGVLNVFAPGTDFFPENYTIASVKQVYVE